MWFVTKKIYDYLMRKDVTDDKKDKIITRFKPILLHLIKEMPASKYVAYLTNPNLPIKVREMIGNEINTLSSSEEYLSNEKFKAIKPYFNEKKYYKEEYLKLPFFPNEFKKIIIDNVYDDSIVDLIHKSHLSITLKKVLVDLKLSMDDAKILLSRNISTDMRDYIIDSRINTPSEIDTCLYNRDIPEDIKDKIVRQKITKDNLFQVLRYLFSSERERIYKHKSKENSIYTGREVAIFTDCHSMYEPTLAVLEDIRRNGIDEIYSLGDNVGLGPNPSEVFDLLEEYNVKSVAGNSEYYNTLGLAPFPYFYKEKIEVQEWTERQLGPSRISKLKLFPASIDLFLGDQKIALCHFANDCRWDFRERSTHTYQANFYTGNASEQFAYTNSEECNKKINDCITSYKKGDPHARGYISAKNEPLFQGKKVTDYDAIIQGHVHFHMKDELEDTQIRTLRAVGMGYEDDEPNSACYYVLKERKDKTFDIERRLVPFNKNSLLSSIYTSSLPNKELVLRYVKTSKDK